MNRLAVALLVLCLPFLLTQGDADAEPNWPHWRGPNENGLVHEGNPPVTWNESTTIKWKAEIPGMGHATPLVWGNRIFVQTAMQTDQKVEAESPARRPPPPYLFRYAVLALDRETGKVLWEKTVREAQPHEGMHPTSSYASTSGTTDGERLYAYFGSQGLYCLDLDGNLKWDRDFGDQRIRASFGEGNSPTLHGNTLLINWDHEDDSFLAALDKRSGEELWRVARDEPTSWTTPCVVDRGGKAQVIVPGTGRTRSYDLSTGKLIWECAGLGTNVVPMPVHANGVVYVTSGHRSPAMQAILLDKAKGDIAGTDAVLWSISENTPYVSSPLLYGDRLYFVSNRNAILSCYNAKTGDILFGPEKLEGMKGVYASFLGVDDRVYISDLGGTTLVIRNSPELEVIASNKIDESISASPVVVGDELYLRGQQHLYCIANTE